MRKKYQESIRKKKEDEERLKLIKIEQEKQLKEINQLIYYCIIVHYKKEFLLQKT